MRKTLMILSTLFLCSCAHKTCKMKPWDLGYDDQGHPVIIRAFGD